MRVLYGVFKQNGFYENYISKTIRKHNTTKDYSLLDSLKVTFQTQDGQSIKAMGGYVIDDYEELEVLYITIAGAVV